MKKARKRTTPKRREQIYGGKRPAGYRLAHNHVAHDARTPNGLNGFRRFWIPPEWIEQNEWVLCECGWREDLGPHYRHR